MVSETPEAPQGLPLYIDSHEIAKVAGWTTKRTRGVLRAAGALLKRGRLYVTTRHLLREHFPEVYEELLDRLAELREGTREPREPVPAGRGRERLPEAAE
jgi:hypothetical protein